MSEEVPPLSVDAIIDAPLPVDSKAVDFVKAEKAQAVADAVEASKSLQDRLTVQEIKSRKQDRKERLRYASRVFWLLVGWLLVVGVVVFFQGFRFGAFRLSDSVVLAILGSTTVAVIGIFLIVTNYLFPRAPRPKA